MKQGKRANPHDTFVKRIFSEPQAARGLVGSKLSAEILALLDLDSLVLAEPRGIECLRAALVYLSHGTDKINRSQLIEVVRNTLDKSEESLMPTIADEWIREGLMKGREEGREEGLQAGIRVVLELRFPAEAQAIIAETPILKSPDSLKQFLELCKSAASPADLLAHLIVSPHD